MVVAASHPISLAPHGFRWLYVDFNSYFASVEQQLRPELRGRPVAVIPVETDATCAIAASYEAKAYGIKTGTPIYEAKKLCPDLTCVLANHEHYVEYHHRILAEMDNHLPVSAVCSIDEVACRLMDNETSPERVAAIAASIKRGLARNVGEYVRCSIGVAPNRYLAKVATDLRKPDGFTTVLSEQLPGTLLQLKLRDLPGIGANMQRRLNLAGVWDMAGLWALEPKQMRHIWGGVWGERMWYLLRGYDLPEIETQRSSIGHSHVMAPELRRPENAIYVARRLTLKAASRLRRLGYYAAHFTLSLRLESGERLKWETRCYRAQDSPTFLHLLNEGWRAVTPCHRTCLIKKLSITLSGLSAADTLAPELFQELPGVDMHQRARGEKISHALDRINHRFGRDSAVIGMLPAQGRSFSGTKVAFTRIPDREEFLE